MKIEFYWPFFPFLMFASTFHHRALAHDLESPTCRTPIYVSRMTGISRRWSGCSFTFILPDTAKSAISIDWVRFDLTTPGSDSCRKLFGLGADESVSNSAIDRRRIDRRPKKTLAINPDHERLFSIVFRLPGGCIERLS